MSKDDGAVQLRNLEAAEGRAALAVDVKKAARCVLPRRRSTRLRKLRRPAGRW